MELQYRSVLSGVFPANILCKESEWTENLAQIQRGELHVKNNSFEEGGRSVRVVSTSQLEGFHSALKKLLTRNVSIDVGLRILDWFIVKHNLSVGTQFGRNPALKNVDLIAAGQAALLCGTLLPTSPQMEHVLQIFSSPLTPPQYRTETQTDFDLNSWCRIFERASVNTSCLEKNINQSRQHRSTITELLTKSALVLQSTRWNRNDFFESLRLSSTDSEGDQGFSLEEHELLRQLRREQAGTGRLWSSCEMVTTVMFNIVVCSNTNSQLRLRKRSYGTLAAKIKCLRSSGVDSNTSRIFTKIFTFSNQKSPGPLRVPSAGEADILRDLFKIIRSSREPQENNYFVIFTTLQALCVLELTVCRSRSYYRVGRR
ncbi:hypothetical protein PHMEG_00038798 [Phytophthora megakarya]|uniref:Uncharacterized protein n=1 Tax=Phytophthora megakarya TaxID=4795 RepID=A0A225UJG0_9STRA|nr:hypothetical protein PHMEG_00038798 [Phytophthora megakarya]